MGVREEEKRQRKGGDGFRRVARVPVVGLNYDAVLRLPSESDIYCDSWRLAVERNNAGRGSECRRVRGGVHQRRAVREGL
ncbi:hypothetical protein E2542_SST30825 [Spatholobus suberectus]|nr:hypothetical protein E2542_SST30825 [Spatholobus suberectus]